MTIEINICNFVAKTKRSMELKDAFGAELKNARVINGMEMEEKELKVEDIPKGYPLC